MTDESLTESLDTSSIMRCYALLGLGMPLTLAPVELLSAIGLFFVLFGTIWAYRIRKKKSAGDLFYNHGRWLVRTFWISSLYITIAMIVSASIITGNADSTALDGMAEALQTGASSGLEVTRMILEYQETNKSLILVSTIICFGPVLFFALARFFIGYRKADQGKPIDNVTTWLIL